MSIVSAAASRFFSSALYLTRLAVHRLGLGPVVLAVTAAAALVYSWRTRRPVPLEEHQQTQPRRRRRTSRQSADPEPADRDTAPPVPLGDRKPRWLARVKRVTIGSKWTSSHRCDLFCDAKEVEKKKPDGEVDLEVTAKERVMLRPEVVPHLRSFSRMFDLYFIVEVESDEAEEAVAAALKDAGLFEPGLLDRRKLLFCETDMGKASIARQIESQLHVDESTAVVNALQRFVPYVSLVTANAKSLAMPSGSNVTKFTSLASFFS